MTQTVHVCCPSGDRVYAQKAGNTGITFRVESGTLIILDEVHNMQVWLDFPRIALAPGQWLEAYVAYGAE